MVNNDKFSLFYKLGKFTHFFSIGTTLDNIFFIFEKLRDKSRDSENVFVTLQVGLTYIKNYKSLLNKWQKKSSTKRK